jgi:hypothetical protein
MKIRVRINKKLFPKLMPEDYYTDENGLSVFTANYHLKRGYCCGNRCRHCPYDWENVTK